MIDPHQLFGAVVALNGLFASLAWFLARPNWPSTISVLAFAVLWPFVDKPLGGRTIWTLSEDNGVTTGDLLSVIAVGIVAVHVGSHAIRTRNRDPEKQAADALG